MKKSKFNLFIFFILFVIGLVIYYGAVWFNIYFHDISIEEINFLLLSNLNNTNKEIVLTFIKDFGIFFTKLFSIPTILYIIFFLLKYEFKVKMSHKNKEYYLNVFPLRISIKVGIILLLLLFTSALFKFNKQLGIIDYIKSKYEYSTLYEDYFVDPKDVKLEFPDKKKNLIYIFLESMESTYSLYKVNNQIKSIIPNLEKIAKNGDNFSWTQDFGGTKNPNGTGWTVAGMVAQTSGIPINLPIDGNLYGNYQSFLPGVTSLGDILEKEGYNQTLLIGSDANFGGRSNYFLQHGNYEVFDYIAAKENNLIPADYFVYWGYEDLKLFEIAKEKVMELSKGDKPFNLTMLTVDTHFMDGYMDESCPVMFDIAYANAIYCSDSKINDFINWLKKQSFYKDTVVVLIGDHLTMNSSFIFNNINEGVIDENNYTNDRAVYNVILNSVVKAPTTKNRQSTLMDFFPTTLAAMGVKIEGDRLGLGVNLYSEEKTISEKIGYDKFNEEIMKSSNVYNKLLDPKNN